MIESLTARNYQLQLLNQAKQCNTIAVLETGSGKTLISGLLIKYLIDFSTTRKICVFLAPTVPLVMQQAEYLRNMFGFKVGQFFGAMGVNSWTATQWIEYFDKLEVFVMTPSILVDVLQSKFILFDQLHLIVFDECHHARKNDPYSQIIQLYRLHPQVTRPKIFGMTASPVNNKTQVASSIKVLEHNMESKAFTSLLEHVEQVLKYTPKPIESIVYYDEPLFHDIPKIYILVHELLHRYRICEKIFAKVHEIIHEAGTWAAFKYIELNVQLLTKKYVQHEDIYAIPDNPLTDQYLSFEQETNAAYSPYKIEEFQRDLELALGYFKDKRFKVEITDDTISSKIVALRNTIAKFKDSSSFCGIVFVQKRMTAILLHMFLKEAPSLEFLKCGYLIGHGSKHMPDQKEVLKSTMMKAADQKRTIQNFKDGELNILISTKVGEEGLDIQSCMLVIRYDPAQTLTDYIQSRGRARHSSSHYINLCQAGILESIQKIENLQQEEINMKNVIRDEDDSVYTTVGQTQPLDENEIYTVESTGAQCTIHTSIAYLYKYCAHLPKDEYLNTNPEFQISRSLDAFQFTLTLPMMVSSTCRVIIGPFASSKKLAKASVCLRAIKALHEIGEVDDRLRAIHCAKDENDIYQDVPEIEPVIPSVANRVYDTAIPKCFIENQTQKCLKRVVLVCEGVRSVFGFVADKSCPDINFTVDYSNQKKCHIDVSSIFGDIDLSVTQLNMLHTFHAVFLSTFLRNSCFEKVSAWGYNICPVVEDANGAVSVDWEQVKSVHTYATFSNQANVLDNIRNRTQWMSENCTVRDPCFYDRSYQIIKIIDTANPETPITKEFIDSIEAFEDFEYNSTEKFASVKSMYKTRLHYRSDVVISQPLLLARKLPYPNEFLVSFETPSIKKKKVVLLLPQTCMLTGLNASFLTSIGHQIPLIMRLIEHELIVLDYQKQLNLTEIPRNRFRVALTNRNMKLSYDYERPEILGDAFIKFSQSLHLFSTYRDWHEGRLSMVRAKIENNEYLRTRGTYNQLPSYILSGMFFRKQWTPAMTHSHIVDGEMAGMNVKKLSDKTIADCVEAIIGVCVEEDTAGVNREVFGMRAMRSLLTEEFKLDWQKDYLPGVLEEYDQKGSHLKRESRLKIMETLGDIIGYEFKRPIIALEALTHASYMDPQWPCGCFQRLEFLGDAVMLYIVTRYIYHKYPNMPPGALTEYRTYLISNEFLACVSSTLGLHKLMYTASVDLQKAIVSYANRIQVARHTGDGKMYWRDFKNCPKAIADVYESLIGAIFIDSGMNIDITEEFILRTLIVPWIAYIGEPDPDKIHPTSRCIRIIQQEIQCLKFKFQFSSDQTNGRITCSLVQHGEVVCQADARIRKDARYEVSNASINVLIAEKDKLIENCTCSRNPSKYRGE